MTETDAQVSTDAQASTATGRRTAGPGGPTRIPRAFGLLTLLLAALLVLNTLIGPLAADLVDYRLSASLRNQLLGLELVTVLLVVPVTVWGAWWSLTERAAGPLLVIGPAGYAAYMFVQYVLGPEYGAYSLVVLFHLAVLTLSGALALWGWALSGRVPLPPATRRRRRAEGLLLLGFAAFVTARYAGALSGALAGAAIPVEFAEARTFYWSIFLMDLGVVVPATVVAGVARLRGAPVARRAVPAVVGWFALVPPSVASMAVVMLVRDDPHASVVTVVVLSLASLVFAGVAAAVFSPLLRLRTPRAPWR
jgi:hypothetical protein